MPTRSALFRPLSLLVLFLASTASDGHSQVPRASRSREDRERTPRRGIPVNDPLLVKHCDSCHRVDERGMMGRISFMRKNPEGWELSMKRMIRHHELKITPDEARSMIRTLSHRHGLTRSEAATSMYEAERRVHWSEAEHDQDLRDSCGGCHTLGRVFSQRRDLREWQLLKATHLAFFPLSNSAFRGRGRRSSERTGRTSGSSSRGTSSRQTPGTFDPGSSSRESRESSDRGGQDRADRVLADLARQYPLFTPEWEEWQLQEQEVPVAGTWTVIGHEVSRGDVRGFLTIERVESNQFTTRWQLRYGDGKEVVRTGRGVMYAGYSWRGRTTLSPDMAGEPRQLREVLLLDGEWKSMKGRLFTGGYNELGMDVTLHRHTGAARIFGVDDGGIQVPSRGRTLVVHGHALPEDLVPADFHLGAGITVTGARRIDAHTVDLTLDVERQAVLGPRRIAYRTARAPKLLTLYDTIDYIRIEPGEGFARVGGVAMPKQLERFEAVAVHRGPDEKPYTEDDVAVRVVDATWKLEEFHVRENDDDVKYVGTIDEKTGVFVPAVDGPNPKRKWRANNIGNVHVSATATLGVPIRPEKTQHMTRARPTNGDEGWWTQAESRPPGRTPRASPVPASRPVASTPLRMQEKTFRARGHLLVTVPVYVRYDRFEWDRR